MYPIVYKRTYILRSRSQNKQFDQNSPQNQVYARIQRIQRQRIRRPESHVQTQCVLYIRVQKCPVRVLLMKRVSIRPENWVLCRFRFTCIFCEANMKSCCFFMFSSRAFVIQLPIFVSALDNLCSNFRNEPDKRALIFSAHFSFQITPPRLITVIQPRRYRCTDQPRTQASEDLGTRLLH